MKHITYHASHNRYKIMIRRGKQFFNMETKLLVDAEKIRDDVLVYYDEHQSLPTRQQIGLKNGRQGGTGLYEVKPRRSINDKCTKCDEEVSYKSKAAYQRFLDSDKECLSCRRVNGKKKSWGQSKLFNITFDESRGAKPYRVSIFRKGELFYQHIDTLENAIATRDKVLDFYKQNGRLPNEEECVEQFGIRVKGHTRDSDSNISKPANSKFYEVKIARKRKMYVSRHETLSEAQAYRDKAIKYYSEHNALPTVEQVKYLIEN